MRLIIVESPTKASTFNRFLKGDTYHVEATMGHIRDLPEKKMGIDTAHDFKPDYVISPEKKEIVDRIVGLAKKAKEIILATDADREGEAISYHIAYLLGFVKEHWPDATIKNKDKLKRIVFHEITKDALDEALAHPQSLNLDLVSAQQARRILDRIVGYELSPLLWKKMGKRWLSAGRVQTVALRFIVEREKEIASFEKEPFFKGIGVFLYKKKNTLTAELVKKDEISYEKKFTLTLFDGIYTYTKTTIDQKTSELIHKDILSDTFVVEEVSIKTIARCPPPPYTTSSLQQDVARTFGWSSSQTMRLAQQLYERGYITYHRTDSVTLSPKFISAARGFIESQYGKNYVPERPFAYKAKSKLAQEAHEAIRPTKVSRSSIDEGVKLTLSHKKLYDLIFARSIASQMKEASIKTIKVEIRSSKGYLFVTSWEEVLFDGFLRLVGKKKTESTRLIPQKGEMMILDNLEFKKTETNPPPRYSEASLIKTIEERGIGRPSTYAPTLSVIQSRYYVEKKEGRFYSTQLGTAVCDYLSASFVNMFKIDFTAQMEDSLDAIAQEKRDLKEVLSSFYTPFSTLLAQAKEKKGFIDVEEKTDEVCPTCGKPLVLRYSRFGKFFSCSGYPDCTFKKSFVETIDRPCPTCGAKIVVKYTKKKRKFYGCANYPTCTFAAWRLNQISSSPSK